MDIELLKVVGQIAGIGGIAVGALVIIFRNIIRKNIFPSLSKEHAYRLLRLIAILVWSVAIVGIAAWTYASTIQSKPPISDPIAQVYVTKSGEKFHQWDCQHNNRSSIPMSRADALVRGYEACKTCTP